MLFFAVTDIVKQSKLDAMYHEYSVVMYTVAYDVLFDNQYAEDAVHESFLRIIDFLDRIPEDRDLRRNFFVTVSKHTAINIYNKRKKYNEYKYSADITEDDPGNNNPADIYIGRESVQHIKGIIFKLDDIYKDVLYLNIVYGLKYEEIARILDIKVDTVRKRANRAKKMVANQLRKEQEDEKRK